MASEHDVFAAWLKICRADTTATVGLVALAGRPAPAVAYGDPEALEVPVIVLPDPSARVLGGAPYRRTGTWRAEARVPTGSRKLAYRMLDRLEFVTTYAAFAAEGLDVRVEYGGRAPEPPGDAGGYRIVADYRLTLTV